MEKFSTWRDASNGIAPFVLPVPTGDDKSGPLLLVARLFQAIFGAVRFLLFIAFIGLFALLDASISALTSPWPGISHAATKVLALLLLRPCLAVCFGIFLIQEEQAASRRRSSSARNVKAAPGDLVVSNWSSYIDVIYLTYRYGCNYAIPLPSPKDHANKYIRTSFLGAMALAGRYFDRDHATSAQTLELLLKAARKPLVVFAEGTTSNNRAILRFATTGAISVPSETNVFLTVLKHDSPSTFRPTVTCPIPAKTANPLPQIFFACLSPVVVPRHLLVRVIPPSEAPSLSASNFWRQAADAMCTVGKLKQTNLGAEEKVSFLEYYFSKSKPRSRDTPVKARRKA